MTLQWMTALGAPSTIPQQRGLLLVWPIRCCLRYNRATLLQHCFPLKFPRGYTPFSVPSIPGTSSARADLSSERDTSYAAIKYLYTNQNQYSYIANAVRSVIPANVRYVLCFTGALSLCVGVGAAGAALGQAALERQSGFL